MSHKQNVSQAALIQRINRKLAADGERLRTLRGDRWRGELGEYYLVNDRNCIVGKHVDTERLACELGLLKASEQVR